MIVVDHTFVVRDDAFGNTHGITYLGLSHPALLSQLAEAFAESFHGALFHEASVSPLH